MQSAGQNRLFEILVVEDDVSSCYLIKVALGGTNVNHHLTCVNDGSAAVELLKRKGAYAEAARPDLIFLDLHMPKKNGWEILSEIKTDPVLRRIPVIVMTSSSDQEHVNSVYDLHANCYLQKPSDWTKLCHQVRLIEEFWFGMVLWPTPAESLKTQ